MPLVEYNKIKCAGNKHLVVGEAGENQRALPGELDGGAGVRADLDGAREHLGVQYAAVQVLAHEQLVARLSRRSVRAERLHAHSAHALERLRQSGLRGERTHARSVRLARHEPVVQQEAAHSVDTLPFDHQAALFVAQLHSRSLRSCGAKYVLA